MHSDPTRNLIEALTAQRVIVRQLVALGAFLGACAAWRLLPVDAPEPLVGVVLLVGGLAMAFAAALAWAKHEDARSWTDDLIVFLLGPRQGELAFDNALIEQEPGVVVAGGGDMLECSQCVEAREERNRKALAKGI